jgi:hypothetical protein
MGESENLARRLAEANNNGDMAEADAAWKAIFAPADAASDSLFAAIQSQDVGAIAPAADAAAQAAAMSLAIMKRAFALFSFAEFGPLFAHRSALKKMKRFAGVIHERCAAGGAVTPESIQDANTLADAVLDDYERGHLASHLRAVRADDSTSGSFFRATAYVHENADSFRLQVEMADGHALLISVRKKEAPDEPEASVTLWHGNGEKTLVSGKSKCGNWKAFRKWALAATRAE